MQRVFVDRIAEVLEEGEHTVVQVNRCQRRRLTVLRLGAGDVVHHETRARPVMVVVERHDENHIVSQVGEEISIYIHKAIIIHGFRAATLRGDCLQTFYVIGRTFLLFGFWAAAAWAA